MTDRKPPELFPGLEWEKHEFERGCWEVNPSVWCQLRIRGGVYTATFDVLRCGVDRKFDTQDEALDWLRARIIAHRDELCRVTGTVAQESQTDPDTVKQ